MRTTQHDSPYHSTQLNMGSEMGPGLGGGGGLGGGKG